MDKDVKMKSDYMEKRVRDKLKSTANAVVSKVVSYGLKSPALYDFYEGEAPLDWDAIKATSPLRVVFQATYGRSGRRGDHKPDAQVGNFVQQAEKNDIKYGLYHFLVPNDIVQQAQFYIDVVESLGGLGNMMPILDVEIRFSGKNSIRGTQWAGQVKTWLDIVGSHFGEKPLIYTSKYYWSFLNDRLGNPPIWTKEYFGWFAGYPWLPYLDANMYMPKTYQANGFNDWAVWQYAEYGRSSPPRGYKKFANDLNLISPWFEAELENRK